MKVTEELSCRVCGNEIETVLDFGEIYLSGFVKEQSEAHKAPLALARCKTCGLVQLRDTVDLDNMYRQYWYMSSLNKSMVSSLKNVITDVEGKVELNSWDLVVDIGCNDGTMLGLYSNPDIHKVGFDPALNIEHSSDYIHVADYFSSQSFRLVAGGTKNRGRITPHQAKVVTAIAMYYDLPDPVQFTKEVAQILADDGIFVVQFTDLLSMFKATAFDNICHEHLEYYRLKDVLGILKQANLEAIDVSYNDVNGGSVRVTAAHAGAYSPSRSVEAYTKQEKQFLAKYSFSKFKKAIKEARVSLHKFLKEANLKGHRVFLLGASTKGNTLLQVFNITKDQIPYAAEVNKSKYDLKTVGSDITIVPEEIAFAMQPEYFLVPVWHFEESLMGKDRIQEYIKEGGKLVFPLPQFHIRG